LTPPPKQQDNDKTLKLKKGQMREKRKKSNEKVGDEILKDFVDAVEHKTQDDTFLCSQSVHSDLVKMAFERGLKQGESKLKDCHSFCEKGPNHCNMNYCDENGCNERKRNLVNTDIQESQTDKLTLDQNGFEHADKEAYNRALDDVESLLKSDFEDAMDMGDMAILIEGIKRLRK
jgi:hypothetical protein